MLEDIQKHLQSYQDLYRLDGLLAIIISDRDGVPLIKAADEEVPSLAMSPSFLSPFAMVTDQASKLGMGRNKALICMYSSNQVIYFDKTPFILTLICSESANTGLLLGLEEVFDPILDKLTPVIDL